MVADILHRGHINLLEQAHEYGIVTVGLLTDEAVESYKRKPYMPFAERYRVVSALKDVAGVIPQLSLDPMYNIIILEPNFVAHGDDWRTGAQAHVRQKVFDNQERYNFDLLEFPYTHGISTTSIVERIREQSQ
jgi:phosphoenolpyruvate phosphomutase